MFMCTCVYVCVRVCVCVVFVGVRVCVCVVFVCVRVVFVCVRVVFVCVRVVFLGVCVLGLAREYGICVCEFMQLKKCDFTFKILLWFIETKKSIDTESHFNLIQLNLL